MNALVESRRAPAAPLVQIGAWIGMAPEGVPISFGIGTAAIVLLVLGIYVLGGIVLLVALAMGMFFRDPDRFPPRESGVVLSGADGKVVDVADAPFSGEPTLTCRRVSVFMSPLNVHVNRAPALGAVERIEHTPGKFAAAFRDDASEHNERNLIVIAEPGGRRVAMVQVAGYLARRIVCRIRARDKIELGQRIGLIMFGSRVDHYVPNEYRLTVARGDRVRAGESVIGELS